jgi:hypothetical protein
MIIALCEQMQQLNGSVALPAALQSHFPRPRQQQLESSLPLTAAPRRQQQHQLLEGKPRKMRPSLFYINSANFFDKIKEKQQPS